MSAQLAFSLQWRKILERASACALSGARDPLEEFLSSDEEKVSDLHLFHLGLRPPLLSGPNRNQI
jgi:hypothetical protein